MKRTCDMTTTELAAYLQGKLAVHMRTKITNDPHTWPECDRPLTPAERQFLRQKQEDDERTREAA